jgi:hypothetical protein
MADSAHKYQIRLVSPSIKAGLVTASSLTQCDAYVAVLEYQLLADTDLEMLKIAWEEIVEHDEAT